MSDKMRILVTGGAGFIGSHIVQHLQGTAEVRVIDNLRTGFRRNLDGLACEFIEASILDREALRRAMAGVDYVFHLAAMISVPESMEKPSECAEINTLGTLRVYEEAVRSGVRKLVLSSTSAVYGDNPVMPKVETMLPEPKSPYAVSKLDGEYYGRIFTETGKLPVACLRYFNVFGPRQDPKSAYAAAVPIFTHKAVRNEPLVIFGDGEQTRDFIYVKDIAAANVHFAMHSPHTGVFNVAYGRRITVNELATTIVRMTGSHAEIRHAAERAGDVKHSMASIDKLVTAGFKPSGSLEEGLKATVDYFIVTA